MQNFYFLGGIALAAERLREVADWVRGFKKMLRPDLEPNGWYLKGSGEYVSHGVKQKESRPEAFRRWELWAEHVEVLTSPYRIHATLVLPGKLLARHDHKLVDAKERRAAVLKGAMIATLLTLETHVPGSVSLWIDRVEGAQEEALHWGKEF